MEKIVFCTLAISQESLREAQTLLASLRTFGGELAQAPFWLLVPQSDPDLRAVALDDPQTRVVPFDWAPGDADFAYTRKMAAGAAAEALLDGTAALMAWMAPESLILNEPRPFLLDAGKAAGGRPVDLYSIGPRWDEPLDPFWAAIFGAPELPQERFLQVTSVVDQVPLRLHLNAGQFVVRPERGVLRQAWRDFLRLYQQPLIQTYCQKSDTYLYLMNQAVLAGTLVRMLEPTEIQIFPHGVSYCLHPHVQYGPAALAASLNDLITVRYYLEEDPDAFRRVPVAEPLRSWLMEHHLLTSVE